MTEPKPTYKTNGRQTGTVRWFNRIKGFGFIEPDEGDEQLFAHYSQIEGEGYRNLYESDRVSFGVRQNGDKGLLATNIRQIGGQ